MSNEDRKRIIDEALHGAKVDPGAAPVATAPKPTPCCDHCIHKMAYAKPMQPAPVTSGAQTFGVADPFLRQLNSMYGNYPKIQSY